MYKKVVLKVFLILAFTSVIKAQDYIFAYAVGKDIKIIRLDPKTKDCKIIKTLKGHDSVVTCLDFEKRKKLGNFLASGSKGGHVIIWNTETWKRVGTFGRKPVEDFEQWQRSKKVPLGINRSAIKRVLFHPKESVLFFLYSFGEIWGAYWNDFDTDFDPELWYVGKGWGRSTVLALNHKNNAFVYQDSDHGVGVFRDVFSDERDDFKTILKMPSWPDISGAVVDSEKNRVIVSTDGRFEKSKIAIFDVWGCEVVCKDNPSVLDMQLCPGKEMIAVLSVEDIRIFNMQDDWTPVRVFKNCIQSVSFSCDGKILGLLAQQGIAFVGTEEWEKLTIFETDFVGAKKWEVFGAPRITFMPQKLDQKDIDQKERVSFLREKDISTFTIKAGGYDSIHFYKALLASEIARD